MQTKHFDFDMPLRNIAHYPWNYRVEDTRRGAKMMVVNRSDGSIKDLYISDLHNYLTPKDLLVYNNSKAIPNSFTGNRVNVRYVIETTPAQMVVLRSLDLGNQPHYEILCFPARKIRVDNVISVAGGLLNFKIIDATTNKGKIAVIRDLDKDSADSLILKHGKPNLPSYIKRDIEEEDLEVLNYHLATEEGSIVPASANMLLDKYFMLNLELNNVKSCPITNHVNMGCFTDFLNKNIDNNFVDGQYSKVSKESAVTLNETQGKKLAVGINTLKTLEDSVTFNHQYRAKEGYINKIYIPGDHFRGTDMLLTGFHMPKSQYLVSAMSFIGHKLGIKAYIHAIENEYQFGIYGDAMLVI